MFLQRACYLSINPQKDETLETEKAQYYLPDGSTIEVGDQTSPVSALWPPKALGPNGDILGSWSLMSQPSSSPCWVGAVEVSNSPVSTSGA